MVLSVWGQNPPVLWLYITAEGLQGYSLSLSKVNVPWAGLFNLLHHPGRGPPPCLLTVLGPPLACSQCWPPPLACFQCVSIHHQHQMALRKESHAYVYAAERRL